MLLLTALLACSGTKVDVDDSGAAVVDDSAASDTARADADGDGFLASVDCDDADPAVHPGAEEVWYDGVDQDCDGADDDQDGDGFLHTTDCDDTDPTVHPGAGEVPADGIDQDCDGVDASGGNDADADGDGYAATAYGGPDCDDTDAAIHPGATEVTGDDVDSDCDGADQGLSALVVGSLVITEIMYDPMGVADTDGEWFELANQTTHSVNLRGLVVADDAAYGAADVFTVDDDLVIAAGERLVFAASADPARNGGVTADYDYAAGGVAFNNTSDQLYVGIPAGGRTTTIDSVSYDELGGWPVATGASLELNDASVSATANDSARNWCVATGRAGSNTDKGSPGAASSGC